MDTGSIIGAAGILIGCLIAFYQWHDAKAKGSQVENFLLGLKAADLPPKAITQINDQLARLKK